MRPKITRLTPMKPDLHTHTTSSDGLLTPAELVALAAQILEEWLAEHPARL